VHAADGSYIGPMLAWSIVTQQVEAEERINWLAHYDTLTELPNRATFRDRLEQSLALPETCAALLFIDLDGFKIVNDSKGHLVGDVLLQHVAERLRGVCDQPFITLGRLGGDEFAILLEPGGPDDAAALAARVIAALAAPFRLDPDRSMQIGASIGIAHAPEHGGDAETLLLRADIALYAAKAAGKGTFRVFSPEMEAPIQARVRLETELREALEDHRGFYVFYQPIVDIRTGRVTAREALLRWHHPQRGWISPGEFIPVAEASGLIDRLGQFVLTTACREAVGWEASVRIAVNVSAAQLGRGTLVSTVRAALDQSGLPAHRLEIEVTETALLGDGPESIRDLHGIRAVGVRVALDDFGTGFSSLAHLRAFPFDKIKIDGSFVRDSVDRPDCAAVVKAVADLGRRLGVTTVAEGVETQAHLARVIDEGCLEAQGYLFGRPSPSQRDAAVVASLDKAAPIPAEMSGEMQ
jgi:diguanylate cyclase (GGDEF)-like protein